jgi:hypothetical protein
MLQDELAEKYNYKKLPPELSKSVRNQYLNDLSSVLNINGDNNYRLYSKEGTLIATGYNRIVIGDYGAFIEFDEKQIIKSNIQVQKGQEYRYNDKYKNNVKYYWLTTKDNSGIKICFQQKIVTYADYIPKMYYICPSEILI